MNHKRYLFKAGCMSGAVLLTTLTGCIGYGDEPRAGVYVAPPVTETVVVVQDDYIYYPSYEVYYSSSRREYAYREGNAWVARPAPRGVAVNVLLASPSVKMNFHDSPAQHHATVVKQYPKNWRPAGSNRGQKESEQADQHAGNDGR